MHGRLLFTEENNQAEKKEGGLDGRFSPVEVKKISSAERQSSPRVTCSAGLWNQNETESETVAASVAGDGVIRVGSAARLVPVVGREPVRASKK